MPRKGKGLDGTVGGGYPAVDRLGLIEALGSEIMHEVVGVVGVVDGRRCVGLYLPNSSCPRRSTSVACLRIPTDLTP